MPVNWDDAGHEMYRRRVIDTELDELLGGLPAIGLEGPKGVGKTATARQRAQTVFQLDHPADLEIARADSFRLAQGAEPILIDEWQRHEPSWDVVRRAVDADHRPGRFLLTGSAGGSGRATHSGAGRIVRLRVRPLTLVERGIGQPTVSMASLLAGTPTEVTGTTAVRLQDYVSEIVMGGFPGIRLDNERLQRQALDGYVARIADAELPEIGVRVRNPATLRRWMAAYAAATATTTSYDKIRGAATAGLGEKPSKTTTIPYRDALERLWILEPLHAWIPSHQHLTRLGQAPKHHLADPALAARLVGATTTSLLAGEGPDQVARTGTFLGALFESLATLSVRVFAQPQLATVSHFRTHRGDREVDLIVEGDGGHVVAMEVKLSETVDDADVKHLLWLRHALGPRCVDTVVLHTGPHAFRRADGVAVVPLALLGP
jgi:predicted AAA+ superfamily ATPase